MASSGHSSRISTPVYRSKGLISADRIRISGSKVKTGCSTCKVRRIKCCFTWTCAKNVRLIRDSYTPPKSAEQPIGNKFVHYVDLTFLNPEPDLDSSSRRALDFFRHQSCTSLDQPFDIGLWSDVFLRLLPDTEAVKHAIIALATLHEGFLFASSAGPGNSQEVFALQHYGRSIQFVVKLNTSGSQDSTLTTLATCLLYCAIESLQGHFKSAHTQIIHGMRLLVHSEHHISKSISSNAPTAQALKDLRRTFIVLAAQAMALTDQGYDRHVIEYLQIHGRTSHIGFESTGDALTELATIINDIMLLLSSSHMEAYRRNPDNLETPLLIEGQAIQARYLAWTLTYHKMLVDRRDQTKFNQASDHAAFLTLKANQALARIMVDTMFYTSQMVYDEHLEQFKLIVRTVQEILDVEVRESGSSMQGGRSCQTPPHRPVFNLNIGIVPSLYYVCSRCRDPATRYAALDILRSSNRREGLWDASLIGEVARQYIAVEEYFAKLYRRRVLQQHSLLQSIEDGVDVSRIDLHSIRLSSIDDFPDIVRIEKLEQGSEVSSELVFVLTSGDKATGAFRHWQ